MNNLTLHKVTINNLKLEEINISDSIALEITIGKTCYKISEREGSLRISVEGQIVMLPLASNAISVTRNI